MAPVRNQNKFRWPGPSNVFSKQTKKKPLSHKLTLVFAGSSGEGEGACGRFRRGPMPLICPRRVRLPPRRTRKPPRRALCSPNAAFSGARVKGEGRPFRSPINKTVFWCCEAGWREGGQRLGWRVA